LFVTSGLHSTDAMFTVLYSVFSLGAVTSALVVAHRGLVSMRHILIGAVGMGVTMLALSAAPNVATEAPVIFVVGMASILYMTSTTAIVQVTAKREMHGRLLALQTVLVGGTGLIGGPVSGWLADLLGGVVCLAAAGFGFVADRHFGAARAEASNQ